MAENVVKFKVDGDAKPAIRDFEKLAAAQQKIIDKLKEQKNESKRTANAAEGIAKGFKTVATAFVGGMGINAAIQQAISLTMKWEEYVNRVSTKVEGAAKGMTSFALLQDPGTKASRVSAAANLGARYGISPESGDAWKTVQAMQSLPGGTFESGMRSAESIFQGRHLGMQIEGMTNVAAGLVNKGDKAWKGVALSYLAGQASHKEPDLLTNTSTALPFWDDPTLAFAAAIPVLAGTGPGEYDTYLRQAGRAMQSEEGATGKLWKKLGVSGKSQQAKLAALYKGGYTTAGQLEKAGINEIRQSVGLANAAAAYPSVMKNYQAFSSQLSEGMLLSERQKTEAEVPQMRSQAHLESLRAQYETNMALSPRGMRSILQKSEEAALTLKAQGKGLDWMLSADGRLGPIDRSIGRAMFSDVAQDYRYQRYKQGVASDRDNAILAQSLAEKYQQTTGHEWKMRQNTRMTPMGPQTFGSAPGEVSRLIDALEKLNVNLSAAGLTEPSTD